MKFVNEVHLIGSHMETSATFLSTDVFHQSFFTLHNLFYSIDFVTQVRQNKGMNVFDLKELVEERIGSLEHELTKAIRLNRKYDISSIEFVLKGNLELVAALDHSIETGIKLKWITAHDKDRRDSLMRQKLEEIHSRQYRLSAFN